MKICVLLVIAILLDSSLCQTGFYFDTIMENMGSIKLKKREKAISEIGHLNLQLFSNISHILNLRDHTSTIISSLEGEHSQVGDQVKCITDVLTMVMSAQKRQVWAVKMLDAIGKPPADILSGNLNWLGSYDECMSITPEIYMGNRTPSVKPFSTQYCQASIVLYPILSLPEFNIQTFYASTGMCLPDTCNNTEASTALTLAFSQLPKIANRSIVVYSSKCHEEAEFDGVAITAIVVLSIIAFLTILGTVVDVLATMFPSKLPSELAKHASDTSFQYSHNEKSALIVDNVKKSAPSEPSILKKLLVSFSIYTNGKKLLNTTQSSETLTALNGVRFLSISWVVLGHTYGFVYSVIKNVLHVQEELLPRWTFQAIGNALVSVDSFFALSGLLIAYLTLKELERCGGAGSFNWIMFYFHRFWRLTPPYMLILLMDVGLYRYISDGPLWQDVEKDHCKESWWWNLLYINNFEIKDNVQGCFGHAWYLANDMQFFVLSPLMLVTLFYNGVIGTLVCGAFLLGTWITTGVVSAHYDLPPTSLGIADQQKQRDYMKYYYVKPWCRMGPYVVGILTGYLLYKVKGRIRLNKVLNLFIWAVVTALALVILYGLHDYFDGKDLSNEVNALYNTTHRTLWGVCVCWVIFACATGNGGFVNTLLSWSAFAPLARLSYCIYLVHPFIIFLNYFSRRDLITLTDYEGIYLFLGNLVLSIMVAIVASLLFEAPMLGLEKTIFKRGERKAEKHSA